MSYMSVRGRRNIYNLPYRLKISVNLLPDETFSQNREAMIEYMKNNIHEDDWSMLYTTECGGQYVVWLNNLEDVIFMKLKYAAIEI